MNRENNSDSMPVFQSAFLHPRHWGIWILMGLYFLISFLPVSVLDTIGAKLGDLLASKNPKRFAIAKTNLQLCFPEKTQAEIDDLLCRHFRFLMRGIMHYGLIWWSPVWRLKKHLRLEGFEQIEKYREQGKNIILLLSHCTGLEFAVAGITLNYLSSGPYKPLSNPVVDWFIARGRVRFQCRIFTRDDGLRPLIKQAREGRVIIYLADEDLGAGVSVFAPFFGVEKATIPLLGRLSGACKAVVLPCFSCYDLDNRQYRIRVYPPMEGFPSKSREQDAAMMNSMIEQTIRDCPEQYFWILKYFKTRPEGETPFY